MAGLLEDLGPSLIQQTPARGEPYFSVTEAALAALAATRGAGLKEVMAACLKEGVWPERFRPNRGSLSSADQARLLQSRAVVIGAGGLGGMVLVQMARLGVGGLVVADGDVFDESNLNRQMLSRLDRLGRNKAVCAADEIAALNPVVEVNALPHNATPENLPGMLAHAGVVIDCLDNLASRYQVQDAAREAGIPFVHGSVAGWEGMLMVVYPQGPGLAELYGPIPPAKEDSAEVILGVPTTTPALMATLQVNEAMKLLLGRPALPPGRVLHMDLSGPSLEALELG